jgi:hypothetical protein
MRVIEVGDRFGSLVVVKDSGRRYRRHRILECLCDCGKIHFSASMHLASGKIKSCGCGRYKRRPFKWSVAVIRDSSWNHLGKVINKLTLIDLKKELGKPLVAVLRCECGSVIQKPQNEFLKGKIKSCGCLSREISIRAAQRNQLLAIEKKLEKERKIQLKKQTPRSFLLKEDLSGLVFGGLTVLYWCGVKLDKCGHPSPLWYCRCKCGKEVVKTTPGLHLENASCGCFYYERRKARAIILSQQRKERILEYLDEEWEPRDDLKHKNRRMCGTIKSLLLMKFPHGCVICGHKPIPETRLCAHHYKAHALFPKLRYLLSNQVLLCEDCHNTLHKDLGWENVPVLTQVAYIAQKHADLAQGVVV